ncbi:S-layer homology domain-containing protein [Salibacterium lacus]|uniref:S-layer homology domain-containing protein n=1 Tax=Salibacterium lacus TaxID=1898109 RepID=A0ABW5T416_9BACI
MKKVSGLALLLYLIFSTSSFVSASDSYEVDYDNYEPGVTVEENDDSPTGYYATFIYEDETAAATKVELYSNTFLHFTREDGFENPYQPKEYEAGMFPAGGNDETTYNQSMEKLDDNLWGARVPLSSGAFTYNFRITNPDGTTTDRLDDPNNSTLTNTATNISSLSSMVYVPYNSDTMGTGEWLDRSVELPNTDNAGTVETVSYTGAAGDDRGLAVYLPEGYDPNREEPYKVLYMSHGASGDDYGNELRWMNEGAVANITDNMIADGKTEPFVVVTMNNQDFEWDFDKIEEDQFEHIMPYVETNYNVGNTPENRAYAGLSMGGITTNRMYFNHADKFSYFGIWSYAVTEDELKNINTHSNLEDPSVMIGTGIWDFGLEPVKNLSEVLNEQEIDHDYLEVPGAHDWETWQLLYTAFVEDHLWKSEQGNQGNNGGDDQNGSAQAFEDVNSDYWAQPYINNLYEAGIVKGHTDGTFGPSEDVTRAQFAVMLSRMLGLDVSSAEQTFEDVPAWAADEVNALYDVGIVTGKTDGSFQPQSSITREQMAAMVVRAYEYEGSTAETADVSYEDSESISSYAQSAVEKAASLNLMNGTDDNLFQPKAESTRAQAAKVVSMLYDTLN